MRFLTFIAVLTFVIDQLSKWLVVHVMDLKSVFRIDVFPPFLNFRMGWNTGINFGLFSGSPEISRYLLVVVAVAVSGFLIWWSRRSLSRRRTLAGAGMIVGGALANALDRVLYGAVADFLNMSCCGLQNPYTFNVADIAIFVGAFLLVAFDDRKGDAKHA